MLLFILFLAVFARLPYIVFWDIFYNADYALVGLIGKHFLEGDYSFYHWGQGYHANVEPVFLALLFRYFDVTPQTAALLPFFVSLAFLTAFYFYLKTISGPWIAAVASLFIALPSPFYMSVAMRNGNYMEIVLLGLLQYFLLRWIIKGRANAAHFLLLGLLMGFSWFYLRAIMIFWLGIFFCYLVYYLTPARFEEARNYFSGKKYREVWEDAVLLKSAAIPDLLKKVLVALNLYNIGNFALAVPLWFHGPWSKEIFGKEIKLDFWPLFESSIKMTVITVILTNWRPILRKARELWALVRFRIFVLGFFLGYLPTIIACFFGEFPESRNGIANARELLRNLRLFSMELFPQIAGVSGIPLLYHVSLILAVAAFITLVFICAGLVRSRILKGERLPDHVFLMGLFCATLLLGITYDRLTDSSTLRYFFPLYLPLAFGFAMMLAKIRSKAPWAVYILLGLFLSNQVMAHMEAFKMHEKPQPHQALAAYFEKKGVRGGYADYWIAYYVNFISKEKIILTMTQPEERNPRYLDFVRTLDAPVYVGETALEPGSVLTLKGIFYRIESVEEFAGFKIAYLSRKKEVLHL